MDVLHRPRRAHPLHRQDARHAERRTERHRQTERAWREGKEIDVHLIDGPYELFRHFYAMPSARDAEGREVAAVRGVVASVLGMINGGATHVGVATDHVIESFRNDLWAGDKTGAGVEPDLLAPFSPPEERLAAPGAVGWPGGGFE